eukprot:m.46496 g.46496  ORF g.46496 m.46496 type:complete len:233 (+) comp11138_c0_seq2:37-735(+)
MACTGFPAPPAFDYIEHTSHPASSLIYEPCFCKDNCAQCPCAALPGVASGAFDKPHAECGPLCKCEEMCLNRDSQRPVPREHLEAFATEDRGWGVRTTQPLSEGQFVCDYAGELITRGEAAIRAKAADAAGQEHYLLVLREHVGGRVLCTHVDASRTGSIARFINHSCSPNLHVVAVRRGGLIPHLVLRASRAIRALEELTFDYGTSSETASVTPCRCGVTTCRGFLPATPI